MDYNLQGHTFEIRLMSRILFKIVVKLYFLLDLVHQLFRKAPQFFYKPNLVDRSGLVNRSSFNLGHRKVLLRVPRSVALFPLRLPHILLQAIR